MRVLYYTTAAFLDQVLSFMPALGAICEVDLVVEVSPEGWNTNMLGDPGESLHSGVLDGSEVLGGSLTDTALASLAGLRSFHAAVHTCTHTRHPRTVLVSRRVRRFIAQRRPDVVHMNDVSLRLLMGGGPPRNIPLVLSVHDPLPHSGAISPRAALGRRVLFHRARRFILHNESQRTAFGAAVGVPDVDIEYIRLGPYDVYRSWQRSDARAPGGTVLFLGRLAPYKGLDVFVCAAHLASEALTNTVFVIAGRPVSGCSVPATQNLANGCTLSVRAKNLSNGELVGLVEDSRFVVLPYRDATQSGVLLTAYALGRPVVVSRVGGLSEYVSSATGLIVPPNSAERLADAIVDLVTNPKRLDSLREGVNRYVREELRWDALAAETARVYARAVES
jgi:glycosyltransferase involved in cell wall biosynthesis